MSVFCWSGLTKLMGGSASGRSPCGSTGEDAARGSPGRQRVSNGVSEHVSERPIKLGDQLDRLLKMLPEDAGVGQTLRDFWGTFSSIDLRPMLSGRRWTRADFSILDQVRRRCLVATYPFALALRVLDDSPLWRRLDPAASPSRRHREAAAAEQASEQWESMLVVQRVLGPLDTARVAAQKFGYDEVAREIFERRERYLSHARAFQVVAALLCHGDLGDERRKLGNDPAEVEEACYEEVQSFVAAQEVVPLAWRHFGGFNGQ